MILYDLFFIVYVWSKIHVILDYSNSTIDPNCIRKSALDCTLEFIFKRETNKATSVISTRKCVLLLKSFGSANGPERTLCKKAAY